MNYTTHKVGSCHVIKEVATGLQIASFKSFKRAKDLCLSLNLGSGFDGRTPDFFTKDSRLIKKATTRK